MFHSSVVQKLENLIMRFAILATAALVPRVTALQCYACTQRFDHYGNHINGNENCVNLDGDEYLIDCTDGFDGCMTETLTQWNPEGDQTYQLMRSCGKSKANTVFDEVTCNQAQLSSIIYKVESLERKRLSDVFLCILYDEMNEIYKTCCLACDRERNHLSVFD